MNTDWETIIKEIKEKADLELFDCHLKRHALGSLKLELQVMGLSQIVKFLSHVSAQNFAAVQKIMKIWQISIQALEPSDYYLPEELALLTNQSDV